MSIAFTSLPRSFEQNSKRDEFSRGFRQSLRLDRPCQAGWINLRIVENEDGQPGRGSKSGETLKVEVTLQLGPPFPTDPFSVLTFTMAEDSKAEFSSDRFHLTLRDFTQKKGTRRFSRGRDPVSGMSAVFRGFPASRSSLPILS